MKTKFQIGDIVFWILFPENKYQIIKIIGDSTKSIKGDWCDGATEALIEPNCYIFKSLRSNKLVWDPISLAHERYQLFKPAKNEPLKWKNYEEILI